MISLDHIGIAVADSAGLVGLSKLFGLMGLGVDHTEPVPEQGVNTHFVPLPLAPVNLEFLEVTDPVGTVAKFVEKRGAGIHHLSFRVGKGELDGLCGKLRAAGVRLTYDAPRNGAHGMRINFIHPASAGGILVEIMEPT